MGIDVLLASFGAGVFAAMIGGLPVFILTGFLVVAGLSGGMLAGAEGWGIINTIGFGIFLGPHTTFTAGVAAAIYAKKKGLMETGDITVPLIKFNDPMILVVGGIFGVIGYVCNYLLAEIIKSPTDTIALTVVISGIIARIAFSDKGLMPSIKNGNTKYFPTGNALGISLLMGGSIGFVSAYYAVATGDVVLAWALSAIGLIFVQIGQGGYAFHHIGITAALAAVATGNVYVGLVFGVIAALLADTLGAMFNRDADSHIDPPAIAIFILTTIVMLFL